jgi:hypothetical protein
MRPSNRVFRYGSHKRWQAPRSAGPQQEFPRQTGRSGFDSPLPVQQDQRKTCRTDWAEGNDTWLRRRNTRTMQRAVWESMPVLVIVPLIVTLVVALTTMFLLSLL